MRPHLLLSGCLLAVAACAPLGSVQFSAPGQPAGWALVRGHVAWADGAPMVDTEVLVTACAEPVGGLAGAGRTDDHGDYSIWAQLPSTASVPDAGLVVECRLVVARGVVVSGSQRIRFRKTQDEAEPLVVDLRNASNPDLR